MYKLGILLDLNETDIPETHRKILNKCVEELIEVNSDDPQLLAKIKEADLLLSNYTEVTTDMINAAVNLKYIGAISTAFEYIDMKTANENGIIVTNLGAYSREAVAEFIFAAILAEFRELRKASEQAQVKTFNYKSFMGTELMSKSIGVLGAGKIGSRVCEIAVGFNMKVAYFARSSKEELDSKGALRQNLDEIFTNSDILAVTLPQNEETEKLISSNLLSKLKSRSVIISTSPLAIFNEDDLLNDLSNNKDHLFITDQAEDLKKESLDKYQSLKNVILYPNLAFRTAEATENRWRTLVGNVRDSLDGIRSNVVSQL